MAERLSFRVLGPLEVLAGEGRVSMGGARQRVILAMLLLNSGQVISIDRIAEAVWGDRPPPTARRQVVICVSGLRRILAEVSAQEELIRTTAPGYAFQADPEQLDLEVAARLAAEARAAQDSGDLAAAARLFQEACGLWRGPVLPDIDSRLIESIVRRVEDKRLTWTEERGQLELALGRHREMIDDWAALVGANPLRERLRAQLMLAYYRSGRRAEALASYREGYGLLAEELGIEPAHELRNLHDSMLRGDLELDTVPVSAGEAPAPAPFIPSVPAQLPADVPHFTGRVVELAALDALVVERLDQGVLTAILITGVGGVGKTGLAVHWAHRMAASFPEGQLFVDLRGYDPDAEPLPAGTAIDRFLRALGIGGERIPEDLDERAALLRTVIGRKRMMMLLDNARTIDQVRLLLPGSPSCCVIVTSRDPLVELTTLDGAGVIHLDVLGADDSAALLMRVAGSALIGSGQEGSRLGELCDGLPLALRIIGARLNVRSRWTPALLANRLADERRRLDELSYGQLTVRASFALSYRDLPPPAARLFRRLGLIDAAEFAAWTGAAVLDVSPAAAEALLDQLVDAQMLNVVVGAEDGRIRYRFHDLVRLFARERALEEEVEEERLAAIQRVLGGWLALAGDAHERQYGGDFTHLHSSAPRWRALGGGEVEEPLGWFSAERAGLISAISQAAHLGMADFCWDLAVTTTTFFEARSFFDDWQATHEIALAACEAAGDQRGRAAVLYSIGSMFLFQQVPQKAREHFDHAHKLFEDLGDDYGRALVLRNASLLDRIAGRSSVAMDNYSRAADIFAKVGDRFAYAHVLGSIAQIHLDHSRLDLAEPLLVQALAAFTDMDSDRGRAQILNRLGELLLRQDRLDEAHDAYLTALDLTRRQQDTVGQAYVLRGLAEIDLRKDAPATAGARLKEALTIALDLRELYAQGRIQNTLGQVKMRTGHYGEAAGQFRAAAAVFAELDATPWRLRALRLLGEALQAQGAHTAAADIFRSVQMETGVGGSDEHGWPRAHLEPEGDT
ncbi:BTAD domain-containing putative transcriptional regulator [Nonomuraea sp. NPDC005650]|uniref:AfsR/SARP family transcriptional regulator n=1 Tax=Nonomuraea sp. NPDC005650 TaxID=3157045 RepID=UPI0033BCD1DF